MFYRHTHTHFGLMVIVAGVIIEDFSVPQTNCFIWINLVYPYNRSISSTPVWQMDAQGHGVALCQTRRSGIFLSGTQSFPRASPGCKPRCYRAKLQLLSKPGISLSRWREHQRRQHSRVPSAHRRLCAEGYSLRSKGQIGKLVMGTSRGTIKKT